MQNRPPLSEAKRKLLEQMRRASTTRPNSNAPFNIGDRENPLRLSPAQEQVWRLDRTAARLAPLHNESITIHRRGLCEAMIVQKCMDEIVRRHEVWRTSFHKMGGTPIQVVHPNLDFQLGFSDLRKAPAHTREAEAIRIATEDAKLRFDVERGPLFRARLVTLSDDDHKLFLTAHQSIVDGITVFEIFPRELSQLYESFAAGGGSSLPDLPAQFGDFSSWQQRKLAEGSEREQLSYWEKQLSGELPVLNWPREKTRPEQQTYRGAMYPFQFPKKLAQSLKQLAKREGATLFMVLLAGFYSLLRRYSGQDDIIIGTLSPCGRKQSAFQHCMGYFLNPVALRANLSGNPSFQALLRQVREVTLGAISNDDVTLEMIAEKLQLKSDPSRHLFFTVGLSLAPEVASLPPGWSMTYMDVESGGARWDLYVEFSDRQNSLMGRAQYNPDLFSPADLAHTIAEYRQLLESISISG